MLEGSFSAVSKPIFASKYHKERRFSCSNRLRHRNEADTLRADIH